MVVKQRDLTDQLITIYTKALSDVKLQSTFEDCLEVCIVYGVNQGVCMTMATIGKSSSEIRDNLLIMAEHLDEYRDQGNWWAEIPARCKMKYEIIQALEYRLELLYEILQKIGI